MLLLVVRQVVLVLVVVPVQGGARRSRRVVQSTAGVGVQYVAPAAAQARGQGPYSAAVHGLQMRCQSGSRRQRGGRSDRAHSHAHAQAQRLTEAAQHTAAGRDDGTAAPATCRRHRRQQLRPLRVDLIVSDSRIRRFAGQHCRRQGHHL